MDAIRHAFDHVRTPSGLFYWGHITAYDALGDIPRGNTSRESIKLHYPYYELLWKVDPGATKKLIEALWCAHIIDWSNLDFNRSGPTTADQEEPWDHEYDEESPTFFTSKHGGRGFSVTATSLIQAGTTLYKLSRQEQPLVWSKRLAKRFVDTRHPKTGIAHGLYNYPLPPLGDGFEEHFQDRHARLFPFYPFEEAKYAYWPENVQAHQWMSLFLVGQVLGENGRQFTQWALEELTAWAKASYRKKDNSFVPLITDGTSVEGYMCKESCFYAPKGAVAEPVFADVTFFWGYAVAYRTTRDEFMWRMVRDISLGNHFGDTGKTSIEEPRLRTDTTCSNVYALLGFLELHNATGKPGFLKMARRIGDNILNSQFHKGFFVPSKGHIYTRFGCFEPLALLHLGAAIRSESVLVPQIWPSCPLFVLPYRYRQEGVDRRIIYTLTESPEVGMSLQEAASIGDIDLVRSLLDKGIGVDSWDDSLKKTALQRAAMAGHREVVELLLARGARIDAQEDWPGGTALDYAAENGHKDIVQLLIARGAHVNATRQGWPPSDTPLHSAVRARHTDIVELLIANGADVSVENENGQTPIEAAVGGGRREIRDLLQARLADSKVKAFIKNGVDVNAKDAQGMTPLHLAAHGGHREVVEFLLSNDADVNAKNNEGRTPLDLALSQRHKDVAALLAEAGADVPTIHVAAFVGSLDKLRSFIETGTDIGAEDENGRTPLLRAIMGKHVDVVGFLIEAGADVNTRDAQGYVPLVHALWTMDSDIAGLLLDKGADVHAKDTQSGYTSLHWAVMMGSKELTELILEAGGDVNAQSRTGETPMDLAKQGGPKIIELLKKHMLPHDVTITNVSVPSMCVQGDVLPVTVTLDNRGDCTESCAVKLMDAKNDRVISRQSATIHSKHRTASDSDLIITGEVEDTTEFGNWCCADGDVNGDGFKDLLITAHHYPSAPVSRGRAYLYYGGPLMDNTPDKEFTGEEVGDTLGGNAGFLVDMNNDNFDDVILGAKHHGGKGRVYVFYGGTDMDEKPDIIIDPPASDGTNLSFGRGGMHPGDFNGDGIMDLVCSALGYKVYIGRAYLYYGPLASDTTVDKAFTGETPGGTFGAIMGVGDVNGDHYDDLLVATRYFPAFNLRTRGNVGRAYLYYGASGTSMDTDCDVVFDPPDGGRNEFGSSADVFDIDNDGFADVLIGARRYPDGSSIGRVYVYWGKANGFDNTVGLTITGEAARIALGGDFINCRYADDDPYGDILVTAFEYNREQSRAYLYHGGPRGTMDAVADHIFTPESGRNGVFRSVLADLNNDGYGDVVMTGGYYNNLQGRAWLWDGPFNTSTNITFNWDTTTATPGKHTLRATIAPIEGEENVADNSMTVDVEVKPRLNNRGIGP
jgi:pectate lyase